MLRLVKRLEDAEATTDRSLTLCYADRCKSRLRVMLDDGTDAGTFLPRGTILRGGDVVSTESGECVLITSAPEPLFEVRARKDSDDAQFDLRRAAYHLGNRHIPVHLLPDALRIDRDLILKDMLRRLGLEVIEVIEPFEPESGAYGGGHRHDHDHDPSAGMIGEMLSRQAHGETVPEFSRAVFEMESGMDSEASP